MIPGQVSDRVERSRRFHAETGKCLSCWMIENELRDGRRLLVEDDDFVAFIPYAALSPFHTWIFPRAHAASFATLSPLGVQRLAGVVSRVMGKVYAGLGNPAFNLVFRSLSPRDTGAPHLHWYVSLVPRLSKAAGFELGTGMYVNAASPEHNAEFLRDLPEKAPAP
jgi:UDPglucose--hexose-1-phosphate uridylyltransferase